MKTLCHKEKMLVIVYELMKLFLLVPSVSATPAQEEGQSSHVHPTDFFPLVY